MVNDRTEQAKRNYYQPALQGANTKTVFALVDGLPGDQSSTLPSSTDSQIVCEQFLPTSLRRRLTRSVLPLMQS